MKIESVRARVVEARPERGVRFSIGRFDVFSFVLVEVRVADGLVGYGEAIARYAPEVVRTAVEALFAPILIGEDARDIGRLWVAMIERLRRWGHHSGIAIEALSGVDIALWDVVGKAQGQPVWRMLYGTGRSSVPVYASSLYIDTPEQMAAQATAQVDRGFRAIKAKIGRSPDDGGARADVESLGAIRDAVGRDIELMVDANGAYDAATAIQVARALEPLAIAWFEEPVPPDDLDGYRRIHSMTTVPLAAGESVFGPFGFRSLIADGFVDYVQPDIARCGGITAARQIAALVYTYNRALAPHTGFSGGLSHLAALHIAAAAPAMKALEYMFIDNPAREIFDHGGYPQPHDGLIDVPEASGLGLDLDHELIDRLTVSR